MLQILRYILIGLGLCWSLAMLLFPRYRTRELIWLPSVMLGGTIELAASLFERPFNNIAFFLGAAIALGGIFASRRPRPKVNGAASV